MEKTENWKRVGRPVWPHMYNDQAGESKRVGSFDIDAQRSGSLETLRFQGETVVLASAAWSVNSHYGDIISWVYRKINMSGYCFFFFFCFVLFYHRHNALYSDCLRRERVTFCLLAQRARSLPCACAFAALYACAIA